MIRRKILVVHNPVAGTTDPNEVRAIFDDRNGTGDTAYTIYETEKDDDVTASVRTLLARGFDLVIVAGGDGTVSSVTAALVETGVPLAILPAGTANVLAKDLDIPHDLRMAMQLTEGEHRLRSVDVMRCGTSYLLLNIGIGLTPRMMAGTNRERKSRIGFLAYIVTGLKKIVDHRSRRFIITADGVRYKVAAVEILVVNSPVLGLSALRIAPDIRVDDGRMHLFVIRSKGVLDYLKIAAMIVFNKEKTSPNITRLIVDRTVTIDADKQLPVQGDGDVIAKTPITIDIMRRSVRIVVPNDDHTERTG